MLFQHIWWDPEKFDKGVVRHSKRSIPESIPKLAETLGAVLLAKETTLKTTNFNKLYLSTYSFYYNSPVFYWSYLVYLIPASAAFLWIWGFLLYGTQKCSLGSACDRKARNRSQEDLPWLLGTLLSVENKFLTYITNNKQHNSTSMNRKMFHKLYHVVCFLLGKSPASEFYMPTFWNTLSVPSS